MIMAGNGGKFHPPYPKTGPLRGEIEPGFGRKTLTT